MSRPRSDKTSSERFLSWTSDLASVVLTCEVLVSLHKEGEDLREEVFLSWCEVRYLLTIRFIFTELDLIDDLQRLQTKRRERILGENISWSGQARDLDNICNIFHLNSSPEVRVDRIRGSFRLETQPGSCWSLGTTGELRETEHETDKQQT